LRSAKHSRMSKIIISMDSFVENDFIEKKKVTYQTTLNWEMFKDINRLHGSVGLETIIDLMTDNFKKLLTEAVHNLERHPEKQVIIEDQTKLTSTPVIHQNGASLSFGLDETMITTLRGNESCK
jgi:hypothetical protein